MKRQRSVWWKINKFSLPYLWMVMGSFILLACQKNDLEQVQKISGGKNEPIEKGKDVEIIYTDSALLKARVFAPLMEKYQKEDEAYLEMDEGLKARFYNKTGEVNSFVKSNYGIRYLNQQKTILRENVEVVNKKGDTLNTEELIWNEQSDKVHSQKHVRVRTEDEIIFAQGFESNIEFTEYKFYNIKGTVEVEEPGESDASPIQESNRSN